MELSASSNDLQASAAFGELGEEEETEDDLGDTGEDTESPPLDRTEGTAMELRLGRPSSTSSANESGADCKTEPITRYEDTEIIFVMEPTRLSSIVV